MGENVAAQKTATAAGYPVADDPFKEANDKLERATAAQAAYARFSQKQVDHVFSSVAKEMMKHRLSLAKFAVQETRLGQVEDKAVKNGYAAEYVYDAYKDCKTVGLLRHDPVKGIDETASPVGPIAAILPTTNPTSTVIVKSLMALKSGNAIVHLPHPRAKRCSAETARLVHDAAVKAGAPEGIVQCVGEVSLDITRHVLHHERTRFILATGGGAMVKAAYSSGKPALGVGSGNAPVLVDESADLRQAVASIVLGKTFDNGTICASEQSTVIVQQAYDEIKKLFTQRGVHFVEGAEREKLGSFLIKNGAVNADVVGQPAKEIARLCGFEVPSNTVVLGAEAELVGPEEPFSHEKLSPILTLYKATDFDDALDKACRIARYGGKGHTAVMYTDEARHRERIQRFELAMPACHLIVNMPSSAGAIGLAYNFNVDPSLTIGVGSEAGSSTSANVTPMHLINIKKTAVIREHIEWLKVPQVYFNRNCTREALNDLVAPHMDGHKDQRCIVITELNCVGWGYIDEIRGYLRELGVHVTVFSDIPRRPTIKNVRQILGLCEQVQPDSILALGHGAVLDTAKVVRLMYEHPGMELQDLEGGFLEIRRRTTSFPLVGSKVRRFIAIPTASGKGSEVAPTAYLAADTEAGTGHHVLCSYKLMPDIAIIDARFTEEVAPSDVAKKGFSALARAVESAVSVFASDFTSPLARRAVMMLFQHLQAAHGCAEDLVAREAVHHASAIAGMACANAFVGICSSMADSLWATFGVAHGLGLAACFDVVVRYNSDRSPTRMAAFPQYKYPQSMERYTSLARDVGMPQAKEEQMVEGFLTKAVELRRAIGLPTTIKDAGVSEDAFMQQLDALAEAAFGDQCTGTNPRYPLIAELRQLFLDAYHGTQQKLC